MLRAVFGDRGYSLNLHLIKFDLIELNCFNWPDIAQALWSMFNDASCHGNAVTILQGNFQRKYVYIYNICMLRKTGVQLTQLVN